MSEPLYFYIKDLKHRKYLTAGERYDAKLYHQPEERGNGCENAMWTFELVDVQTTGNKDVFYYRIKDKKHGKYIVAGDKADGHVYHQDAGTRLNAMWAVTMDKAAAGFMGYKISDALHGKCIAAGNSSDGHLYHQDDDVAARPEKRWIIELVKQATGNEVYPDFYLMPGSVVIEKLTFGTPLEDLKQKDFVLSTELNNHSSVQQSLNFEQTKTERMTEAVTVSTTWGLQILLGASLNLGISDFESIARANLKVEVTGSYSRTSSTSYTLSNSVTFSINMPVKVPPHKKVKAVITLSRCKRTIPFTANVKYMLANGKETKGTIKGQWSGVMVTDCQSDYIEYDINQNAVIESE